MGLKTFYGRQHDSSYLYLFRSEIHFQCFKLRVFQVIIIWKLKKWFKNVTFELAGRYKLFLSCQQVWDPWWSRPWFHGSRLASGRRLCGRTWAPTRPGRGNNQYRAVGQVTWAEAIWRHCHHHITWKTSTPGQRTSSRWDKQISSDRPPIAYLDLSDISLNLCLLYLLFTLCLCPIKSYY